MADRLSNNPIGHYVVGMREFPAFLPGYPLMRPQQFWNSTIGRLVEGPTGVSSAFPAPASQFQKIGLALQDATSRGPEMTGQFIDLGMNTLLDYLGGEENGKLTHPRISADPRRINALRIVAHTLQGIPGGLEDRYGLDLSAAHQYRYGAALKEPQTFLETIFQRLDHKVYGVAMAANLQDVFIADYQRFFKFMGRINHAEMQFKLHQILNGLADRHLVTHKNPTNLEVESGLIKQGFDVTREQYAETLANRCIGDYEAARQYRATYMRQMAHPVYGRGGEADISAEIRATELNVQAHVARRETGAQLAYLKAATVEMEEALANDDTHKGVFLGRPDLRSWALRDVIELVTDSPIAQELKHRDHMDAGRDTRTSLRATKYLMALPFGTPIKDNSNQDGTDGLFAILGTDAVPHKQVRQQFFELVANSTPRPDEQARIIHTVAGNNRLALISGAITPEDLASFDGSFTGAVEKQTHNLEQKRIELRTLYDYLNLLKLTSPQVYAELVVLTGGGNRLEKTMRYHPYRMKLAREAASDADSKKGVSPFYAAYTASGKMPLDLLPMYPADPELSGLLKRAFPEKTIITHVGDSDKLDVWDEGLLSDGTFDPNFKGPLYGFSDGGGRVSAEAWKPVARAKNIQLLNQMLGRKGRLTMDAFRRAEGTPQGDFGIAELYVTGMLLRQTPGEEGGEAVKETFRGQYIPLLVQILTDAAQPQDRQEFSHGMHTMVIHVVRDLLPFFPLESQELFVKSLMKHTVWNDPVLLEDSGIINALFPLGWNTRNGFPAAPDEDESGRRQIADTIVDESIRLILDYPYVKGRRDRRYLLTECLGITINDLKLSPQELDAKIQAMWETNASSIRGSILYQLASIIGPFGNNADQLRFAEAIEQVLLEDMLILAPQIYKIPMGVSEFTKAARTVTQDTLKRLNEASTLITQTLASVVTEGKHDDLAASFGQVPDSLKTLAERVVTEAERQLKKIENDSGLSDLATKADEITVPLPDKSGDSLQELITMLSSGTQGLPIEKIVEALAEVRGIQTEGTATSASQQPSGAPLNVALVAGGERNLLGIAGTALQLIQEGSSANAFPAIAQAILDHNTELQQQHRDLAREAGFTDTVRAEQALRQLFLKMVTAVLTDKSSRQQMVSGINKGLEAHEAHLAARAIEIQHRLDELELVGVEGFTNEHIKTLRALLATQQAVKGRRRTVALAQIASLTDQIERLAELSVRGTQLELEKMVQYAEAQINFLESVSADGGPLAATARAIYAILRSAKIPVAITLPTPDALLGDVKAEFKKPTDTKPPQIPAPTTTPPEVIDSGVTTPVPSLLEPNGGNKGDGHAAEQVVSN